MSDILNNNLLNADFILDAIVEMTLPEDNSQIFASRYQTVLPRKEELQRLIADKDTDS